MFWNFSIFLLSKIPVRAEVFTFSAITSPISVVALPISLVRMPSFLDLIWMTVTFSKPPNSDSINLGIVFIPSTRPFSTACFPEK